MSLSMIMKTIMIIMTISILRKVLLLLKKETKKD